MHLPKHLSTEPLQRMFSSESSEHLDPRTGCICATFSTVYFQVGLCCMLQPHQSCVSPNICLRFSPTCVFKWVLGALGSSHWLHLSDFSPLCNHHATIMQLQLQLAIALAVSTFYNHLLVLFPLKTNFCLCLKAQYHLAILAFLFILMTTFLPSFSTTNHDIIVLLWYWWWWWLWW